MTDPEPNQLCPRCQSTKIDIVASSPISGHWFMTSCSDCWYAWRSTEPTTATTPENYPPNFRLTQSAHRTPTTPV